MDVYAALFGLMIFIGNFRFYSTRSLCDVRLWYLNLMVNDVFQTNMNAKQTELKNSIEDLIQNISDNPDSRFKDCRVIEMYNDMLKENFNFDLSAFQNMRGYEVKDTNVKLEDTNDNANQHMNLEQMQMQYRENGQNAKVQQHSVSIDIAEVYQQTSHKPAEKISNAKLHTKETLDVGTDSNNAHHADNIPDDRFTAGLTSKNGMDIKENNEHSADDLQMHIDETELVDETELLENDEEEEEDSEEEDEEDEENVNGNDETMSTDESSSSDIEDIGDDVRFIDVSLSSCFDLKRCNKVCYFLYSTRHCLDMYDFYISTDTNVQSNTDIDNGKDTTYKDTTYLGNRPNDILDDRFMKDLLKDDKIVQKEYDQNNKENVKEAGHSGDANSDTLKLHFKDEPFEEIELLSNIENDAEVLVELRLNDKENLNNKNKLGTVHASEARRDTLPDIDEIANDNFLTANKKYNIDPNDRYLKNLNEKYKTDTTRQNVNKDYKSLGKPETPGKEPNEISLDELEKLIQLKTGEYANKIQSLELMIVNLEKQLLIEQLNKQNHSSTYTRLENIVLKLENDLLRMNKHYQNLKDETERIHKQQSQQLELTQKTAKSQTYLQLPDHSTEKFELISQHQAKIKELSEILQNQSEIVQKFKHRQDMLEEQNRMLHQMVMNQTIFMTSIIHTVQDLSEENIKNKVEMSNLKEKLEVALKRTSELDHKTEHLRPTDMLKIIDSYVSDSHLNLQHSEKHATIQKGNALRDVKESSILWCPLKRKTCPACFYKSIFVPDCLPYRTLVSINRKSDCKKTKELLPKNPEVDDNSLNADTVDTADDIGNSNNKEINNFYNLDMAIVEVNNELNTDHDEMQEDTKSENKFESLSPNDKLDENVKRHTSDDLNMKQTESNAPHSTGNEVETSDKLVKQTAQAVGTNAGVAPGQTIQSDNNIHKVESVGTNKNVDPEQTFQMVGTNDVVSASTTNKINTESDTQQITNNIKVNPDQTTQSVDSIDNNGHEQTVKTVGNNGEATTQQTIEQVASNDKLERKQSIQSVVVEDQIASEQYVAAPSSDEQAGQQILHDKSSSNNDDTENSKHQPQESSDESSKDKIVTEEKTATTAEKPAEQNSPSPSKKGKKKSKSKTSDTKGSLEEKPRKVPINLGKDTQKEPKDCYEIYQRGSKGDGIYKIRPQGSYKTIEVFCDMKKGGWTVILRRQDGSTNFFRKWDDYKKGFGGQYGEHWFGNDMLHLLTNQEYYTLRVELMDWNKNKRYADFGYFLVESESEGYRLHIEEYSGDAGDGLTKHNNNKFSTTDVDNDKVVKEFGGSCADRFHGAGWYYKCYASNLFGKFYKGGKIPEKQYDGITWKPWTGSNYSMKKVVMKIRPKSADDKS